MGPKLNRWGPIGAQLGPHEAHGAGRARPGGPGRADPMDLPEELLTNLVYVVGNYQRIRFYGTYEASSSHD